MYGILHRPDPACETATKTGILFINAGIRSRRGTNRSYVRFARALTRHGYFALRYDPPGIGDSPGVIRNVTDYKHQFLDNPHSHQAAIDFFTRETGITRVGLFGLCGGAYSALMASGNAEHVSFLILTSLPVQELGEMTENDISSGIAVQQYLRKITQWRSWFKLLTGKSQYRWLGRVLVNMATGNYKRPELDQKLWNATKQFIDRQGRMLFVYGSLDPIYPPFNDIYLEELKRRYRKQTPCDIHVVENANHDFSQLRWQNELFDKAIEWLECLNPNHADHPLPPRISDQLHKTPS